MQLLIRNQMKDVTHKTLTKAIKTTLQWSVQSGAKVVLLLFISIDEKARCCVCIIVIQLQ